MSGVITLLEGGDPGTCTAPPEVLAINFPCTGASTPTVKVTVGFVLSGCARHTSAA
jgi:hypothetical protein